jgi:ABC-type oligopeptide transport system substrate-binding subunit
VLKADNISAPDKETVRFKLETPYAPFLSAIPIVMIVNPRVVQAHEANNDWGAPGSPPMPPDPAPINSMRRLIARWSAPT